MRTPKHLDPYAPELTEIWRAGWGLAHYRTPVGVFVRLERGIMYRGGIGGWWWRPTLKLAVRKAMSEASANPAYAPPKLESEW